MRRANYTLSPQGITIDLKIAQVSAVIMIYLFIFKKEELQHTVSQSSKSDTYCCSDAMVPNISCCRSCSFLLSLVRKSSGTTACQYLSSLCNWLFWNLRRATFSFNLRIDTSTPIRRNTKNKTHTHEPTGARRSAGLVELSAMINHK